MPGLARDRRCSQTVFDVFAVVWLLKAIILNSHCRTSYGKHYAVRPNNDFKRFSEIFTLE